MYELRPEVFERYVDDLQKHLFGDENLEEIIGNKNDHRSSRFLAIYLISNKQRFYHYYKDRINCGNEFVFNTIIKTLFTDTDKMPLKKALIDRLELTPEMWSGQTSDYEMNVFMKDLKSFILYARKQDPNGFIPPFLV